MQIVEFFIKVARLVIYSLKGNFEYAFGQFEYTNFIRRKSLHWYYSRNEIKSNNVAVFDLKHAKDRYAFNLINTYKLADYDVFLKPNYHFYVNSEGLYFEDIFSFLNVGYFRGSFKSGQYKLIHYVYDHNDIKLKVIPNNVKLIKVTSENAIGTQALKFPFGFHPNTYKRFNITTNSQLKEVLYRGSNEHGYKIVFAGSTKGNDYDKIKSNFPELMTRNEVFEEIHKSYNKEISTNYKLRDGRPILISDSLKGERISEDKLFEIFKNSDFFIAPPGFEMPFCHNLFEATSCGLVPIIQYSNYLYPNLQHEVNCLIFKNTTSLKQCINQALNMELESIKKMKKNILHYHRSYLSPSSFVNRIENEKHKDKVVYYISSPSKNK
ncbi:glycosyltransferase [Phaeodactylibacter xiamenensis]|uniref:glycosyltransferase n=1 Tax=Phaeodactylibacter xiamenensis TaxID=1524460 RepID=UPI0024A8423F|nr:hypothetical protein [Phaeodactylibacter xiamenensis]